MTDNSNNTPNIPIMLYGITGKMGQAIKKLIDHNKDFIDFSIICGITSKNTDDQIITALKNLDSQSIIIDFSSQQASNRLFRLLQSSSSPISSKKILLGTTGFSDQDLTFFSNLAIERKDLIYHASNTSLGISMLYHTIAQWKLFLQEKSLVDQFDIELTEAHHRYKKDAPSGTAKLLIQALGKEYSSQTVSSHPANTPRKHNSIGVHAIRGGGIYGDHDLSFISEDEIITVSHRALSTNLFAKGALYLARSLSNHLNHYPDNSFGFLSYDQINSLGYIKQQT